MNFLPQFACSCPICGKASLESHYCLAHETAKNEIVAAYAKWQKAYGEIRWERYLETISKIEESGQWIKEVASFELTLSKQDPLE